MKLGAWGRWALAGPGQALGMLALGWACAVASVALLSAVSGDPGAWWRALPGWMAWAWLAKRSAALGWWRSEGAWWLGLALGLLCGVLARAGNWGQAAGWGGFGLWCCLWAWARAALLSKAAGAR